ncbi:DUF4215 domain-containing protein [Nannocystis pusilla]|uniref:DUF4215 domain-containing protein n=1 Tax=Nannocystis pusilla TaxID=889268 RepID=A0A9X3ER52_9BACT|nr:DUF4215 domain-containing protein [Nannocystis pusilla]MCY1007740.1 DUF4215 domain-containing protein [Nannocystis pusilla]
MFLALRVGDRTGQRDELRAGHHDDHHHDLDCEHLEHDLDHDPRADHEPAHRHDHRPRLDLHRCRPDHHRGSDHRACHCEQHRARDLDHLDHDRRLDDRASPPTCGDGVVEDFEQCDDGNAIETDDCASCQNAFCGDGIVHAGVEECDEDGDNCESCARVHMRVFVSSTTATAKLGGLVGADEDCQALADDADLKGTFRAWLSTGDVDAASRLQHAERPYKRIDGAPLADNWADLVDGTLLNPIVITELGDKVGVDSNCGICPVWTATTPMGVGLDDDCSAWNAVLFDDVVVGECTVKDARWTQGCATRMCSLSSHLYCVEQGL